jgi:hypothetical protein
MANAVEMFKQQKAALEELQQAAARIEQSLSRARTELDALARHDALRTLLTQEQQWLARTETAVQSLRDWRYRESQEYGRPLAWRWALATTFALLATAVAGAGYAWVATPYAEEIAYLRSRNTFANDLEARMVRMTDAERRQLDALLKLPATKK